MPEATARMTNTVATMTQPYGVGGSGARGSGWRLPELCSGLVERGEVRPKPVRVRVRLGSGRIEGARGVRATCGRAGERPVGRATTTLGERISGRPTQWIKPAFEWAGGLAPDVA